MADKFGNVAVVLGGQWGDEGKGKLIDIMSKEYDIVARAAGGANAGHTVYVPDSENPDKPKKFVFHLVPSGALFPNVTVVVGNGCVLHIPTLLEEIDLLKENNIDVEGRMLISDRTQMVMDYHIEIDGIQEEMKGKNAVGTTKRGIGPAYSDKASRIGVRVVDLLDFDKFAEKVRANVEMLQKIYNFKFDAEKEIEKYKEFLPRIKPFIIDSMPYLQKAREEGKKILLEGANGCLLDIDHGTYPFVTSSNASIGGICSGTGLAASNLTSAIGVMKAYCTRVGAGPFPTELDNDTGIKLRENGGEYGATTGRPRRCGWFDAVASRYSVQINGFSSINVTKLDVMDDFETIKIGVGYKHNGKTLESFPSSADTLAELEVDYIEMPGWQEDISGAKRISDLPENAQKYLTKLEELLDCPIDFVGVGISRDQMAIK
ncbi:adenylosuccinate synthase [Pseudomonadota bacterium]